MSIQTPGYVPQFPDTEEWAERLLFEHWGRMSPREKLQVVSDLCRSAHEVARAGMAQRHPGASVEELDLRLAVLRLGRETVEQVIGRALPFEPDAC